MHLSRFCTKWWCFRLYNVIHMPFVSSSSDSRWHPCSRHIWWIRPSHGTRTYWWCSQLSCVLPGRWPSAFFLLAMHNQTSFGSALASFVSCRGSSGCRGYGQDTMSHWPKKNPCNWMSYTDFIFLFIYQTYFTSSKLATTDYQWPTEALVQIRNAISILNVIPWCYMLPPTLVFVFWHL